MAKKTQTVQVKVRMTKDLQRRIQREADRHGQTINAEILGRLEMSFEYLEKIAGWSERLGAGIAQLQEAMDETMKRKLQERMDEAKKHKPSEGSTNE